MLALFLMLSCTKESGQKFSINSGSNQVRNPNTPPDSQFLSFDFISKKYSNGDTQHLKWKHIYAFYENGFLIFDGLKYHIFYMYINLNGALLDTLKTPFFIDEKRIYPVNLFYNDYVCSVSPSDTFLYAKITINKISKLYIRGTFRSIAIFKKYYDNDTGYINRGNFVLSRI